MVTFCLQTTASTNRGPGLWKFNCSLLKDKHYVELVKHKIEEFKKKYIDIDDKALKWDLIKCDIRGVTISYSKRKAKETEHQKRLLANKVTELEGKLDDQATVEQYQVLKQELELLISQEALNSKFLAKVDQLEKLQALCKSCQKKLQ